MTAQAVVVIFNELFGRSDVQGTDNFFDLGGHSLLATALQARLGLAFEVLLPLRVLFRSASPAAIAEEIEAELGDQARAEERALDFLAVTAPTGGQHAADR